MVLLATFAFWLAPGGTSWAEEVPPGTGCCFSFDKSPINVVFCNVQGACTFQSPPPPKGAGL